MTACKVVCAECVTKTGPKQWRYLCEECATEKQAEHRTETGHQPTLFVADEDMDEIRGRMQMLAKRFGW